MAMNKNEIAHLKMMANKSITRYIVMTIIGCVILTIGLAILLGIAFTLAASGVKDKLPNEYVAPIIIGTILVAGPGTALTDVGVPCWIALGIQIKVARNKLKNIK